MNKSLLAITLLFMLIACKSKVDTKEKGSTSENASTTNNNVVVNEAKKVYDKILGSFVGAFGDNKITMLITKAENDSISGRTVVGGNDRPFSGIISVKDGKYIVTAKEPGNDKNDGSFSFTIDETNTDLVEGSWASFKNAAAKKQYVLQRKAFKYDINVGSWAKASQKILKDDDVADLLKQDLEMMRNEIFARHGYCFKKKELRQFFENQDWYVPSTVNVVDKLTEIEKKNIATIKRFEKYAEEYGDEFGR